MKRWKGLAARVNRVVIMGFLAANPSTQSGQIAQLVERSPEKAGVGGSSPSLATIF